jgi:ABC-type transport system involved in multi-copper enzyme maturation permease subunit
MNRVPATAVVRWLVADTFRQSLASRIFWLMLTVSALAVLVCLSISTEGGLPPDTQFFEPRAGAEADDVGQEAPSVEGSITFGFGWIRVGMGRGPDDSVRLVQLLLAGSVADTVGLLLALVWTAGFLPEFIQPGTVTVFLAKPVSRGALLVGKCLGVLAFVTANVLVFVLGTWMALGLRTGVWDVRYLACIPLFLVNFTIFFSFSALLAVYARSTVVCVFGTVLFWFVCWGINYGRHAALAYGASRPDSMFSGAIVTTADICYWMFPKPLDLQAILTNALEAGKHFNVKPRFATIGQTPTALVILSSLAFPLFVYYSAVQTFRSREY